MHAIKIFRNMLRRLGYDVVRFNTNHSSYRRMKLISHKDINLIFDVGANVGQYAMQIRDLGYKARIVSFEPLKEAFSELARVAAKDPLWMCQNYALGDKVEFKSINVSKNSYSSSFLPMLSACLNSAPDSIYVATEIVEIKKLNDIFRNFFSENDKVLLKMDTQGYEKKVLIGASHVLPKIDMIQLESSLSPLYDGGDLICDVLAFLNELSFVPVSIEPGFADAETGRVLQADLIFWRQS